MMPAHLRELNEKAQGYVNGVVTLAELQRRARLFLDAYCMYSFISDHNPMTHGTELTVMFMIGGIGAEHTKVTETVMDFQVQNEHVIRNNTIIQGVKKRMVYGAIKKHLEDAGLGEAQTIVDEWTTRILQRI